MGYKDDCAQAAQAQAEGNAQLERQRQNEMMAQRDALRAQNEAREAQQKREDERMERMEKQHDGDLAAMLAHQKDQRAANQARADQLQRDQEERIKEAIQEGSAALDRQRNFNQAESQRKTVDHQNLITKKEAQIAETEKKAEEKVLVLKQQKEAIQEKLNEDKKGYHDKMMEASKQHALEMDKHHEKTAKLQLEREKNVAAHDETVARIQMFSQQTKGEVAIAASYDSTENQFADAVSNTKQAAQEVARGVASLQSNALTLKHDKPAPDRVKTALRATYERIVQNKLDNLTSAAEDVCSQQETRNPNVLKCQQIAREITEATATLAESIDVFMGLLDDDVMNDAREQFKVVQEANKTLRTLAASFPPITKTQHAIGVLVQSTQCIQLGGNFIQAAQTTAAIMNVQDEEQ